MAVEEKTKKPVEEDKEPVLTKVPEAPQKKNNAAIWVLVGCLGIFLVVGLIVLALVIWGGWLVKKKIDEAQPELQKWQQTSEDLRNQANQISGQMNSVSEQMQGALDNIPQTSEEPAAGDSSSMGYIKKVYTKAGKNYLDIDYIQWLTGKAAEQAMREDGQCPKTGECIVTNDYYIRNQNPLIRTFEISPTSSITMETYDLETTGQIQAQKITFDQFSQIWNTNNKPNLQNVPYYITLANNSVVSIKEQYIP